MEVLEEKLSLSKWFTNIDKDLLLLSISTKRNQRVGPAGVKRLKEKYAIQRTDYQLLEQIGDKVLGMITTSYLVQLFELSLKTKDFNYYFSHFVRNTNLTQLSIQLGLYDELFPDADISAKHNESADSIESILGALFTQYYDLNTIQEWFFSLDAVKTNIEQILNTEKITESRGSESEEEEEIEETEQVQEIQEVLPVKKKEKPRSEEIVIEPTNDSLQNQKLFADLVDRDLVRWKIDFPGKMYKLTRSLFIKPDEIHVSLVSKNKYFEVPILPEDDSGNVNEEIRYLNNSMIPPSLRYKGLAEKKQALIHSRFYGSEFYGLIISGKSFEAALALSSQGKDDFERYEEFYSLYAADVGTFWSCVLFPDIKPIIVQPKFPLVYDKKLVATDLLETGGRRTLPHGVRLELDTKRYFFISEISDVRGFSGTAGKTRPYTLKEATHTLDRIFKQMKTTSVTPFYDVPKYYNKLFGVKGKAYGLRVFSGNAIDEVLFSFISTEEDAESPTVQGILAFQCLKTLLPKAGVSFPDFEDVIVPLNRESYKCDFPEADTAYDALKKFLPKP